MLRRQNGSKKASDSEKENNYDRRIPIAQSILSDGQFPEIVKVNQFRFYES